MKEKDPYPQQIDGYYLSFTPKEFFAINTMLEQEGLSQDLEGLKRFILECAAEEPAERSPHEGATDRVIGTIQKFIIENPATVNAALNIGKKILGNKKGPR